jgi:hypothetical protein
MTALVREALDALLPTDIGRWRAEARRQRVIWRRDGVPMEMRKPRLLEAAGRAPAPLNRPRVACRGWPWRSRPANAQSDCAASRGGPGAL